MQEAIDLSDRLIKQLEAADILVIGAPLINFTVCTQLKSWFDYVSIAGRTFKYSAPGVSKGLLFGKKAFVIAARGGDYVDVPINAFDFQAPLLRTLLGFLGIYDAYKRRAAIEPRNALFQLELAQTAESAGDPASAVTAYEKFLELEPDDPNAPDVKARLKQLRAQTGATG